MASIDPIRDIITKICDCTQMILGVEWKKVKYLEDLDLNGQMSQNKVFGIRALAASEVSGVTKFVTLSQTFELVLVRSKLTNATGDSAYLELSYDNRRDALCVYKELAYTRLGGAQVLLVSDLELLEPEYIEGGKVVVQRAQFNVTYRCEI